MIQQSLRFFGCSLLAAGLLSILSGAGVMPRFGPPQVAYETAAGDVVALEKVRSDSKQTRALEILVVRFLTGEGRTIVTQDSVASTRSPYSIGSFVQVSYDPENPRDAHVEGESMLTGWRTLFMVVGGLLALNVGLVLVLAARLRWKISVA